MTRKHPHPRYDGFRDYYLQTLHWSRLAQRNGLEEEVHRTMRGTGMDYATAAEYCYLMTHGVPPDEVYDTIKERIATVSDIPFVWSIGFVAWSAADVVQAMWRLVRHEAGAVVSR